MRLIDADFFKRQVAAAAVSSKFENKAAEKGLVIIDLIDMQPTAYDIEKVVQQLEEFRQEMEQFGCSGILTDIIEIVKQGSFGKDVE